MKPQKQHRAEIEKRSQGEHEGEWQDMGKHGDRDRRRPETRGAEDRVPDERPRAS